MKEDKNKKFYDKKEFKDLQLKWYKKLESKGFDDIERTGTYKDKYFDDHTPYLKHQAHAVRNLIESAPETYEYFSNLRKISWDAIVTPKSTLNSTDSTVPLSKVDSRILFLHADGKATKDISNFLRRYYSHKAPKSKTGPKGKPFSVYYVHYRLKKLLKAIELGEIYSQDTGGVKKTDKSTEELYSTQEKKHPYASTVAPESYRGDKE